MIPEAEDFKAESDALYEQMRALPDAAFATPTQFKGWALNDVLEHLHMWNWAAHCSHTDEEAFVRFLEEVMMAVRGGSMRGFEHAWAKGLHGQALLEAWHNFATEMAAGFATLDPKKRLKWAGPDMSARSSVSARLMETWAHGQEVYDQLGVVRQNKDSIKAIVVLGINTFGWSYAVRKTEPQGARPYVHLTAPSGAIWEFGEAASADFIKGEASEFCQVVTQVRNIKDTNLEVAGRVATDWMSKAQCFAGEAETPPAPGTRFTAR